MENAEEILQCLDEFSKVKPKDIPRELEEYLCFVAKTGDPVYQWPLIKCLFREKLISVITEFYETCPSVEIPPCPNVDTFNYDSMKSFILEKLDTFAAAPFTVQRICELLTTPRKEYNRIDKYMRALEKNILVVSTREPGSRRSTENGESIVNGLESEHVSQEIISSDINVEVEMDDSSVWQKTEASIPYTVQEPPNLIIDESQQPVTKIQDTFISESKETDTATCSSTIDTVITSRTLNYMGYTPNITDLIIDPSAVTETPPVVPVETTTALQPDETVNVPSVSEIEAETTSQEVPVVEPPIYVDTTNKDTAIYLGTTETGDPVYRVKYEPYVETTYLAAIPEPDVAATEPTVYDTPEIAKPETTQEEIEEVPLAESSEKEPVIESTPEPEESIPVPESSTTSEKPNWEVSSNSTETAISSSDEALPVVPVSEPQHPEETSEDQVTESNIDSDCAVSQTEEIAVETPKVVETLEVSTVAEEASEEAVVTESAVKTESEPVIEDTPMEVDEEPSESQPETQEAVVSQTDSTELVN